VIFLGLAATFFLLLPGILRVKIIRLEGDHTSYLVLAPHPTLGFVYGGGEEGVWRRTHPGEREPWWRRGNYRVNAEVTAG
jgi:hypothetical protein